MNKVWLGTLACVAIGASIAQADTIALWNFNDTSQSATSPPTAPHSPAYPGTALLIGGTQPAVGVTPNGYASGSGSSDGGSSWSISNFPAQGTASGTAGFEFRTNCTGYANINFEFDYRASNSASKYWDILYSTNGGTTWTSFFPVNSLSYLTTPGNTNFFNNFGNNFPAGTFLALPAAADNNPDVRVRIVAIVDPVGGTGNYITNGTGATYASGNTSTSPTMRVDAVEFKGTPTVSTPPSGDVVIAPNAACLGMGDTIVMNLTVTPGQNPTSASYPTVRANLSQVGGGASVAPTLDLGGGLYSWTFTNNAATVGNKTITISVTDDQNRTGTITTHLGVGNCGFEATNAVVIAQVWGGGGGATTPAQSPKQDYVVLFNRCTCPVNIHGWSLQYGSATGGSGLSTKLDIVNNTTNSVIIPPQSYFLIQTNVAAGTDTGTDLSSIKTPDYSATGSPGSGLNMSGSTSTTFGGGRLALVTKTALVGTNFNDPAILDFVGWGVAANYEGAGAAPVFASATSALFRLNNGCQDSNQNFNDFRADLTANPLNSSDTNTGCTPHCDGLRCPDDIDDDGDLANGLNPDGGVDLNDLLAFLAGFEVGDIRVDLDDDGDPDCGTPDGGVDLNDLLYFLAHFENGC